MRAFLGKTLSSRVRFTGLSRQDIAYKVLPSFLLDIVRRYLRITSEGMDYIPKKGPCIIVANHSGYMGFDAVMLGHQIFKKKKRVARIVAHKLWFFRPEISVPAKKFGLIPATYENGLKILKRGEILILFPEGEEGNFKPSRYRYRLRRFRRGFVRLAITTGAPIIQAVVIGAEETHFTLSQVRWARQLFGIIIPIPLNVIPLPAKWKIKFYAPKKLKVDPEKINDIRYINKVSR